MKVEFSWMGLAFYERDLRERPLSSSLWRHSKNQKEGSSEQAESAGSLILDFPRLKEWERNDCYLLVTQLMALSYSSLNTRRQNGNKGKYMKKMISSPPEHNTIPWLCLVESLALPCDLWWLFNSLSVNCKKFTFDFPEFAFVSQHWTQR